MKYLCLLIFLSYSILAYAQTQIGADFDGQASDYAGTAVSLSDDGSVIAIGAPYNSNNASTAGQVRIFENVTGSWS